jgi:iron complex outermembrane receptor protein
VEINAKYSAPEKAGGKSNSISLSKGFGDFRRRRARRLASPRHERNRRQRDFAKTGMINFTDPKTGKALQFLNGSSRAIPNHQIHRRRRQDRHRQPQPVRPDQRQVRHRQRRRLRRRPVLLRLHLDHRDQPESSRDSIFSSGSLKLGSSGFKAFFDAAYTEAKITARIAPYPADFSLSTSSPLFSKYLQPYLTPEQLAGVTSVAVKYRLYEMGDRGYEYGTKATHLVAGLDGSAYGWDINGALTWSRNKQEQKYLSGFPLADKFQNLLDSGNFDPFAYQQGAMPQSMRDQLTATGFTGLYNTQTVVMKGADARFASAAGPAGRHRHDQRGRRLPRHQLYHPAGRRGRESPDPVRQPGLRQPLPARQRRRLRRAAAAD